MAPRIVLVRALLPFARSAPVAPSSGAAPSRLNRSAPVSAVSWAARVGCALAIATLGGCGDLDRPGPNVQDVPEGFVFDANGEGSRVFADVEPLDQSTWLAQDRFDRCSAITITTYDGEITATAVRRQHDARAAKNARRPGSPHGADYGPVEETEIDGRTAWTWEVLGYVDGELASVERVAVIPYEDATYSVEFYAGIEDHIDPTLVRRTVESFRAD